MPGCNWAVHLIYRKKGLGAGNAASVPVMAGLVPAIHVLRSSIRPNIRHWSRGLESRMIAVTTPVAVRDHRKIRRGWPGQARP